jgi:hypothetical protein
MSSPTSPRPILRYVLTAGVIVVWGLGIASDIIGGNNPGYVRRSVPHQYPIGAVLVMSVIISVEAAVLYAVLRPLTLAVRPRRALVALAVFVPLTVADYFFLSGWTDQAGYCYANGVFLRSALIYLLVAGMAARILKSATQT